MIKSVMEVISDARKTIEPKYDASIENIKEIINNSNGHSNIVYNAFIYGYVQGMKSKNKQ